MHACMFTTPRSWGYRTLIQFPHLITYFQPTLAFEVMHRLGVSLGDHHLSEWLMVFFGHRKEKGIGLATQLISDQHQLLAREIQYLPQCLPLGLQLGP